MGVSGGKIEAGETAQQALVRELQEEIAITVKQSSYLGEIYHDYQSYSVCLKVFKVTDYHGVPRGNEGQPLLWVEAEELKSKKVLPTIRDIITLWTTC